MIHTSGSRSRQREVGKTPKPLIGDRIASMTKAVGIKPCGGCQKRQKWLNEKHEKLRELMKPKTEEV